jgi:hypothetical protein
MNIEPSIFVVPELLKRLRDVDVDVRKEVVRLFKNKIPNNTLTASQRLELLKTGLTDQYPLLFDSLHAHSHKFPRLILILYSWFSQYF